MLTAAITRRPERCAGYIVVPCRAFCLFGEKKTPTGAGAAGGGPRSHRSTRGFHAVTGDNRAKHVMSRGHRSQLLTGRHFSGVCAELGLIRLSLYSSALRVTDGSLARDAEGLRLRPRWLPSCRISTSACRFPPVSSVADDPQRRASASVVPLFAERLQVICTRKYPRAPFSFFDVRQLLPSMQWPIAVGTG